MYLARISVVAAVIHECGHVLIYRRYTGKWPPLSVSLGGIALKVRGDLFTQREMAILAAAGPMTNFLVGTVTVLAMEWKACYLGYCFAAVNFSVGTFNLLPIPPLDGWQLLELLRCSRDLHFHKE